MDTLCGNLEANDPDTTEANTWSSFNHSSNHDLQAQRLGNALRGNTKATTLHLDLIAANNVALPAIEGLAGFIESYTTSLSAVTIRCTRSMVAIADRLLAAIA